LMSPKVAKQIGGETSPIAQSDPSGRPLQFQLLTHSRHSAVNPEVLLCK
jgi:hypothetical protein